MKGTTGVLWVVLMLCLGFVFLLNREGKRQEHLPATPPGKPVAASSPSSGSSVVVESLDRVLSRRIVRSEASAARKAQEKQEAVKTRHETDAIPNEFVLSFKSEGDRAVFIALARSRGFEILDTMKFGNSVLVRVSDPGRLKQALEESSVPVEYSPNFYTLAPEIPKKEQMQAQGQYRAFGSGSPGWLGISGEHPFWGNKVMVAVLDNGIGAHPALREERIERIDLVNEPESMSVDGEHAGHASAVASIIAGNSSEVQGVAQAASLLSVKVMNSDGVGDAFTLAKGIVESVDRGARVLNISLGTYGDSSILRDAVSYAIRQGVAVVAAVGNEAVEGVSYPARYDGVTAVTAVDAGGRHMFFANRGNEVGIAAPGVGVTAAWTGKTFTDFSGTSASAPFVSGALAALLSDNPNMTPAEAVGMLQQYSDDAGAPGKDNEFGYGILDVRRVMERNTRGIYDMAAGDVYVKAPAGDSAKLVVSAQNRGTEVLSDVTMNVMVNGTAQTTNFHNIAVGQTVSMEWPVVTDKSKNNTTVTVDYSVVVNGVVDAYRKNNSRSAVVFINTPDRKSGR